MGSTDSARSKEARDVIAFLEDVRRMRDLMAQLDPTSDGPLIAETQKLNAQIARSLQRQRRKLQAVLDSRDSTDADRQIASGYVQAVILAQAELKAGTLEAATVRKDGPGLP